MSEDIYDDPFDQFDDLDDDVLGEEMDTEFEEDQDTSNSGEDSHNPDEFGDPDDLEGFEEVEETPAPKKSKTVSAEKVKSKSFIKTPLGIAVASIAVVGAGLAGGFFLMQSDDEPVQTLVVDQGLPVEVRPEQDFSNGIAAQQPEASPSPFAENQVALPAITPPVVQAAPAPQQVAPVAQQVVPAPQQIVPVAQVPVAQAPVAQAPVVSVASPEVMDVLKSQGDMLKEIRGIVDDISTDVANIKTRLSANEKTQAMIRLNLSNISKDVDKLSKLSKDKPVASETVAKKDTKTVAVEQKVVEAKPVTHALAKGKTRLPGYHVIDSTPSGEMTIIKNNSSGRVFTVFKGETLTVGGKKLTVESIADKGFLVIISGGYFIDKHVEVKAKAAPVKSASSSVKKRNVSAPSITAKGYTLNAVYDKDNLFGVVNKLGEFKTYKVGDRIKELGNSTVKGLNRNGDLEVGNHVIKSIY